MAASAYFMRLSYFLLFQDKVSSKTTYSRSDILSATSIVQEQLEEKLVIWAAFRKERISTTGQKEGRVCCRTESSKVNAKHAIWYNTYTSMLGYYPYCADNMASKGHSYTVPFDFSLFCLMRIPSSVALAGLSILWPERLYYLLIHARLSRTKGDTRN